VKTTCSKQTLLNCTQGNHNYPKQNKPQCILIHCDDLDSKMLNEVYIHTQVNEPVYERVYDTCLSLASLRVIKLSTSFNCPR